MSSLDGRNDADTPTKGASVEQQLVESLILHLIEKGVLTKNDALSVVQSVAEVKRGEADEGKTDPASVAKDLKVLQRLYSSFELVRESPAVAHHDGNVLPLRPPLHGNNPRFPKGD